MITPEQKLIEVIAMADKCMPYVLVIGGLMATLIIIRYLRNSY